MMTTPSFRKQWTWIHPGLSPHLSSTVDVLGVKTWYYHHFLSVCLELRSVTYILIVIHLTNIY